MNALPSSVGSVAFGRRQYWRGLIFLLMFAAAGIARSWAGMSITEPAKSLTNQYFVIQYGLGTPEPGKFVYIYVTQPDGSTVLVASAENVSDLSQTAYYYCSQPGYYVFRYEYSYPSQGVGLTDVTDIPYQEYQAQGTFSGVSAPTYAPFYSTATISGTVTNTGNWTWDSDTYVMLSNSSGGIGYVQVSGVAPSGSATFSFSVSVPFIGSSGTLNYTLGMVENDVEYFGNDQSVTIIIDAPPSTVLSASASSVAVNGTDTITSTITTAYQNAINQAIDYIPTTGGDWVGGSAGAGTRWDGSATASETLSPTLTAPSTSGTWQFRSRGQDSVGQIGPFSFVNVTVASLTSASFSGSPLSFTYDGGSHGPTIAASPSGATYSTSGTSSATALGSYSMTITANGLYTGSNTITWSITQASQAAVTISPSSASITAGQSVTFSASGGSGSGAFTWGGQGSGSGSSDTVTFPSAGSYTVTLYRAGDTNYAQSSTVSASITVTASGGGGSGDPELNVLVPTP